MSWLPFHPHTGDLSAVVCSALDGLAGGGPAEEGAGAATGLAGAAGEEADRGEGGAADRPPTTLDEPAEEGRLKSSVPRPGEYVGKREDALCVRCEKVMLMKNVVLCLVVCLCVCARLCVFQSGGVRRSRRSIRPCKVLRGRQLSACCWTRRVSSSHPSDAITSPSRKTTMTKPSGNSFTRSEVTALPPIPTFSIKSVKYKILKLRYLNGT